MIHLIFLFRFLEDKTPPIMGRINESAWLLGTNIFYTRRFKYYYYFDFFFKLDTGRYFYGFF